MSSFNGRSMLLDKQSITSVFTDSCTLGAGGVYNCDWFYTNWKLDWPLVANFHINSKEILAVFLAACRWSHSWTNKRIYIQSDNMTTVAAINRGTSRNPFLMSCLKVMFWLSACFNFHITAKFIPGGSNTVADDISRAHESGRLSKFWPYVSLPLWNFTCLRQAHIFSLVDPMVRQNLMTSLDQEVSTLRVLTFSESTRRTYMSQQLLYPRFCAGLNIPLVPISSCNLGRYIAFLGSRLCYSSVRQYLNIVRIMHLEAGYGNPLSDNWYVASILKGLRRHKGDGSKQKLPITVAVLWGILTVP